uniref:Uncharacterized protein n=1 Tax=Romanomermis culicivorax TaxID=13658 RepID=A0A915IJM1_ROMCU
MAPANRRQIGDARQKIECSKIAKKVAFKVAQNRARRRTSDQILKWILPEQNRQQQQRRSRPRPQIFPNHFRNGSVNNALRMANEFSLPSRTSAIRKTLARIEHNINRNQAILSVRRQGFRNGRENVRSRPRLSRTLESRLEIDEEDASPSFTNKKLDLIRRTL